MIFFQTASVQPRYFVVYGWKPDLGDEEILEKLLSLNLERSNPGR